jgi:hypothetical protein
MQELFCIDMSIWFLYAYYIGELKRMEQSRTKILIDLPTEIVKALDQEAGNEKRSRRAQVECILEERYKTNGTKPIKVAPTTEQSSLQA